MPGSLDQNGVAERRNQALLDMVRSMLSSSNLPKSLWTKALKMTVYILNRVPTKVCLALLHDTAPPAIIKMYPDVDLCELTHLAKSESE